MKLQPLPKLQPIAKLSPTMFATLKQCQLHAGLRQSGSQRTTRGSTAALLGMIVHRVLENAREMNREDGDLRAQAEAVWDKAVSEMEEQLQASPLDRCLLPISRWRKYFLSRERTIRRCEEIVSAQGVSETQVLASERKFDNVKEGFTGKPDLIIRREEGLVIIDYKSSELTDNSESEEKVESWRQQVRFYASIVKEEFGEFPVEGEIRLLNGEVIPIPINQDEVVLLLTEAQTLKRNYNENISEGVLHSELAQYSAESCAFCEFKGACDTFWEENPQPIPGTDDYGCLSGKIAKITSTEKGFSRLVIAPDKTNEASQDWEITNLSLEQFENLGELKQGDSVRLIDFRIDPQNGYHAKPTKNSIIWKMP